ncbi:hypothetical protein JCM9957A_04010 [Kineosporia succinea]|uniref:Uncharacterized protein n=1 Tax=Kineosporia succinea TaxID=84632 RepID=A0ABT9NVU1_9ACTN|nr:hypothetical protein [Kineosporia succinea]
MTKILKARHRRPAEKVEAQPKKKRREQQEQPQPARAGRD